MKKVSYALLSLAALSAFGCNIGNAPEPMSSGDVQAEVQKLSPEQQIDWINRSPMPAEEKQKKIQEIKDKTGYQGNAGAATIPGAPMTGR